MNRKWWLLNGILIGTILVQAVNAFGQTLQPVSMGGGFPWWIVIVAAVTLVAIAGLVVWHKRNPTGQAQALSEAHAAFVEMAGKVVAKLDTHAPSDGITLQGQAGTPGTFMIMVTGDPAVDIPAINAQYFGPKP